MLVIVNSPEVFKYFVDPMDAVGFIPGFVSELDERPAREQINENYCGGWNGQKGFTMDADRRLHFPEDPPLVPLAFMELRDETIIVYLYGYTAIVQPDKSFEVARLD